ncbi:uncharacterized protein LOC105847625 isoform X1 [Hydra vulgaris]|uniref:uncharacterized protein LOC105847625 isoform X1 n=1 Tax=Hydra vulgaris TaxID=6087 RepID=UPI001F5E7A2A|nr:uncharacterized protein LOC105847625 [Hydra vulgaris]
MAKANVFVFTILKTFAVVCLITATMCAYYSLSGKNWIHKKLINNKFEEHGLLLYCTPGESIKGHKEGLEPECNLFSLHIDYKDSFLPNWQQSVFVLSVTASILTLLSTLLFMGSQFIKPFTYCSTVLVFILSTLSSICMLVAMSIYTETFQKMIDDGYKWGTSFAVGWAYFFVNLLSTIMVFSLIMLYKKEQFTPLIEECTELAKEETSQNELTKEDTKLESNKKI